VKKSGRASSGEEEKTVFFFFFFNLQYFRFYRAFIGGYITPLVAQLGFCAEFTFESEQSTHSGG